MRRTQWLVLVCLLEILALAGCLPALSVPGTTPAAALQATDLPASPTGPLPEIAFSDITVVHGDHAGEWSVLGTARNSSDFALEAVLISVELLDPNGSPTVGATVQLPLSLLQPDATSPFIAQLEQVEAPAGARASLASFQRSSEAPASVSLGGVHATQGPDGVIVIGTVQSNDPRDLRIHDVVVTWRDASRSVAGLAIASVPGAIVADNGSLPWIAQAPGATPDTRFEVFTAASTVNTEGGSPLVTSAEPTWRVTSQGRGFATGAIRNTGDAPALPEVAIAASAAGRLISLEILRSTVPMQPGETLLYAADRFPGLEATLDAEGIEITDITLGVYLNADAVPASTGVVVPLPVSIQQSEAIGSSVFLRGAVSNPSSVQLKSTMVFVSLRSTTGEPQSARWLELAPPPAGASTEFTLDLPLAAGVDPAMSEYDVRAFGLPLPESSW
jgi:hypothetical protein